MFWLSFKCLEPSLIAGTMSAPIGNDITDRTALMVQAYDNYYLLIVVAVGIGFLVINLCIYALMIRKVFFVYILFKIFFIVTN